MATLAMCLPCNAECEHVTAQFNSVPLPEALQTINQQLDSVQISFIYDRLEDYIVSATIDNLEPYSAIRQIIGFYPIRISRSSDNRYISVEALQENTGKVIGRLVDMDGKPVEYANVRLYSVTDSSFITGGVSNISGHFVIPTDAKEAILEASRIGYKTLKINTSAGNIGTLHMTTDAIKLKNMIVQADGISFLNDRYVAIPSHLEVKHAYDLFSLLGMQPLPGLSVNTVSQTISTLGGTLLILVNGIKRNASYLQHIRPSNVERFEYYTEVPPQYAGGDIVAVLDIKTKAPKDGGSLFASPMSALWLRNMDIPIGATYNQGKSEFALRYTFNWRDYNRKLSESEQSFVAQDFYTTQHIHNKNAFGYTMHTGALDYTLQINSTSIFTASFSLSGHSSHDLGKATIEDSRQGIYKRQTKLNVSNYIPTIEAYYQKNWNNGRKFEIVASASFNNYNYDRVLSDTLDIVNIRKYESSVHSNAQNYNININYQHPINGNFTLNFKVNDNLLHTTNDYRYDDIKTTNSNNSLWAAVSITYRRGRFNATSSTGATVSLLKNNTKKWNKVFPTEYLTLGYNISDNVYASVEARTSGGTQSLSDMTALRQTYDSYLSVSGNPDLKTMRFWSVRPRVNYVKNNFNLTASLYYKNYWRWCYDVVEYIGEGHFISYPINSTSSYEVNPHISFGIRKLFKSHLNINANVGYSFYRNTLLGETYRCNSWYGNISIYALFGRATIEAMLGKREWDLSGSIKRQSGNNSYLSCNIDLGKGWKAMAYLSYILDSKGDHYKWKEMSTTNPGHGESWIKENFMMLGIGLRYDLSFGRQFNRANRSIYGTQASPDVKVIK